MLKIQHQYFISNCNISSLTVIDLRKVTQSNLVKLIPHLNLINIYIGDVPCMKSDGF